MAHTHSNAIQTKMTELANVTAQAVLRITPQILSNAGREILENLGEDGYNAYIADFNVYDETSYPIFDAKSFDALSSLVVSPATYSERALRNLIYAEAYFGLYHLAVALKKLVKGSVNVKQESAGQASIYASAFDEVINNSENYRELAFNCLSYATTTDSDDDTESELYSDGTLGVFTV